MSFGEVNGDIYRNEDVALVKSQVVAAKNKQTLVLMATVMPPQLPLSNNTPSVPDQQLTSMPQTFGGMARSQSPIVVNQGGMTLGEVSYVTTTDFFFN